MPDETPKGPAEVRDAGRGAEGGAGEQSPLQSRAAFLANRNWESVIRHNRGVCERSRAQHGTNSESVAAVGQEWEQRRFVEFTLGETLDYLRGCHRRAPFLFFNGNTFADIARTFSDYLCESADWKPGDRIQTLRDSAHGVIVRVLEDGRVVWRPDGTDGDLTSLPESLLRERKASP